MLFSRILNKPYHPPFFMQNHQITEVDSYKQTQLIFSSSFLTNTIIQLQNTIMLEVEKLKYFISDCKQSVAL